jgi:leader peptidase (prepilin peptidase)/N-methyltransferase
MNILSDPPAAVFIAVVFGLAIGSFLNVVIHRLPKMMERQWRADCAQLDDTAAARQCGAHGVAMLRGAWR